MPRRLKTLEQSQTEVVYETIAAMMPKGNVCERIFIPDLIRGLGFEEQPEAAWAILRELAANQLVDLHFDPLGRTYSQADAALFIPGPQIGPVKRKDPAPRKSLDIPEGEGCEIDTPAPGVPTERMPLVFVRLHPAPGEAPCGRVGCQRFDDQWKPPALHKGPDLRSYDIIALNTSGGKDSQAMIDAMMREACRLGVQDRVVAYHADLGEMEWPGNKELVQRQVAAYGIPLRIVKHTKSLLERVLDKGEWPSNLGTNTQYCTSELKRGVINTLFTKEADLVRQHFEWNPPDAKHARRWQRPVRILNCTGVRAEESPARSKAAEKKAFLVGSVNHGHNGTTKHVDYYMPIAWWTRGQVWDQIRRSDVPHHFAYDIGMPRLSCVFCVLGNRDALLLAGHYNPELLDQYVEVEKKLHAMPANVCNVGYEQRPTCVSKAELAAMQEAKAARRKEAQKARSRGEELEEAETEDLRGLQAPENGTCPLTHELRDVCYPLPEAEERYARAMQRWTKGGKSAPKNKPFKPTIRLSRKRAWQFQADLSVEEIKQLVEQGAEPEAEPDIGSSGT